MKSKVRCNNHLEVRAADAEHELVRPEHLALRGQRHVGELLLPQQTLRPREEERVVIIPLQKEILRHLLCEIYFLI